MVFHKIIDNARLCLMKMKPDDLKLNFSAAEEILENNIQKVNDQINNTQQREVYTDKIWQKIIVYVKKGKEKLHKKFHETFI